MQKISLTLDLAKLDKTRIKTRTYENAQGEVVTVKEYRVDVVELSPEKKKIIKSGDSWNMVKSHFVTNTATPEERQNKVKTGFVGEGISFTDITADLNTQMNQIAGEDDSSIPF